MWTQEDWSTCPSVAGGLVDLSFGCRRSGRLVLLMQEDWSTSLVDVLVDLLWIQEDRLTPPVDGLDDLSYG